jgi:REP element-mobilizing transposase RayT
MHDYSQPGAYFVTICACGRKHLFGEIINNQMQLNDAGLFAQRYWQEILKHFDTVELDEYMIMPNHVHGIIIVKSNNNDKNVGVQHVEPLREPHVNPNGEPHVGRVFNGS